MSLADLRAELDSRGIELFVRDGGLRYRPRAATTPELLQRVSDLKPELTAICSPGILGSLLVAFDGKLDESEPGVTAEFPATSPSVACWACSGRSSWRRAGSSTEWFCTRCAPPMTSEIEVRNA